MNISIGILARNEERNIAGAIDSIFEQTLIARLRETGGKLEIVVVPNGCADDTSGAARRALQKRVDSTLADLVRWRIEELAEGGKLEAWNRYVHRFSDPKTDYFILMDADIRLLDQGTLWNLVQALEQNREAHASSDTPLKHVAFKKKKGLIDLFPLAIAEMTRSAPAQLSGQLYCARAAILRKIWLPQGLLIDDGFLKQMLVSDLFTVPDNNRRIVRAPNATHYFEAYVRPREVFDNQIRHQVGYAVLTYLMEYIRQNRGASDAGEFIIREQERDPEWFARHLHQRVSQRGWWIMYPGAFGARLKKLRAMPLRRAILIFPFALAASMLDAVVLIFANQSLKKGEIKGLWKNKLDQSLPKSSAS